MFGHSSCSVSSDVSLAGLCAPSHDEESGGFDELPADLPPADLPLHGSSSTAAMPPANSSDHASSGPESALACKMDDLPADLPFHLGAMFWGGTCYFQMCETKNLRYVMSC